MVRCSKMSYMVTMCAIMLRWNQGKNPSAVQMCTAAGSGMDLPQKARAVQ